MSIRTSSSSIHIGPPRPRPNTTPHPASSSRLVRGLGVSGGSSLASLGTHGNGGKDGGGTDGGGPTSTPDDDSVVVDEVFEEEGVESCPTTPRQQAPPPAAAAAAAKAAAVPSASRATGASSSASSVEPSERKDSRGAPVPVRRESKPSAPAPQSGPKKANATSSNGSSSTRSTSKKAGTSGCQSTLAQPQESAALTDSTPSASSVLKESFSGTLGTPRVQQAPERQRPVTTGMNKPRVNLAQKAPIGRGSFGVVYQAMDRDTNHIIAVKEIILPGGGKGSDHDRTFALFRKEIALLRQLDHPNIVKCLGEDHDDRTLRIYMEYVTGGSISSILRIFGPLSEKQASIFTRQMLLGLQYLHARNICHRDLKGDNLLVDTKGNLKLADFGTARELASQATTIAGTSYFMAPEVIRGTGHGLEADVWSCGCCLVEMLTGKPPFAHLTNQYAVMMHVAESSCELDAIPPKASAACQAFLRRCFVRKATDRATVGELLATAWIASPPEDDDARAGGEPHSARGSAAAGVPSLLLSPSSIRQAQMETMERARGALGGGGGGGSAFPTTDSVNPLGSFNDTA